MKTNQNRFNYMVAVTLLLIVAVLWTNNAHAFLNISPSKSAKYANFENSFLAKETAITHTSQMHLNKVQPAPFIKHSVERDNLIARLNRWNNPNKISYIYLMEKGVGIVAYFAIKGKVSSVNSKLTTNQQLLYKNKSGYSPSAVAVESPDMDGSYGSNGDAIFFFTTDGKYMEWNGTYFLSDAPVKLTVQPLMIYNTKAGK